MKFISSFQDVLAQEALRAEVDGVICGHIHHAAMEEIKGVQYMNTGDWVESCTALVEDFDGNFEIITWAKTAAVPGMAGKKRKRPRARIEEKAVELA
jgi:UDP-2,3-diacylglucosamine pyrophosphatase LpxH